MMWTVLAALHFILALLALLNSHPASDALQTGLLCLILAKADA